MSLSWRRNAVPVPSKNSIRRLLTVGFAPGLVNQQLALGIKDALEKELPPEPEDLEIFADGFARGEMFRGESWSMREFRQLCARIDDEARLLWEAQRSFPSPAAVRPCHPENPSRAKAGFA